MAKKTHREKEIAELRRQLEVLKAQAKGYQTEKEVSAAPATLAADPEETRKENPIKIRRVDPKFIKKDLLKTLVLTILALALLALAVLFI